MKALDKLQFYLFAALFFFVPIVLWPTTSEVFEFNKIVLVYILTTGIVAVWLARSILTKKVIFRRTILDIPLLAFLGSQLISTMLSIDPLTSWLGYYSRFNGGLVSIICYSLLYWAFTSNFDEKSALKLLKYSFLPSATLVSLYGVAEHFGIDKNLWVQDVQSRVFSTLGQPNWLAAWLTALLPITWAFAVSNFPDRLSKSKSLKFLLPFGLSILFFWTVIFTKSRSGILGTITAFVIFWGYYFWKNKKDYKKLLRPFGIITSSLVLIALISGTEFTPSLGAIINKPSVQNATQATGDTALETGGTESSTIRKIVWKGAVDIWAHYPVFGTGVETFAFSYYKFRPAEHNLTSEWDFIYNKAHNEFLNMAANSGTVGLLTYLALIGYSVYLMIKTKNQGPLTLSLLAGYVSLSVTNFFGFSVVPTELEFFLFPAFAVAISLQSTEKVYRNNVFSYQKIATLIITGIAIFVLIAIGKYWYADVLYAKGTAFTSIKKPDTGIVYLSKAAVLEPNQALYYGGLYALSDSFASLALNAYRAKETSQSAALVNSALNYSQIAANLSPANLTLKRVRFGLFIALSVINPSYLTSARDTLIDAIASAPTDAKLYYNLGLTYARLGQTDLALATLKKTIELKANYKDARLAYAILLINKGQTPEARSQLEYILQNIDPNDSLTKQTLEGIK